jgi:hypothetical protein
VNKGGKDKTTETRTNVAAFAGNACKMITVSQVSWYRHDRGTYSSHGWSKPFPQRCDSILRDCFPYTIKKARICSRRCRLQSRFHHLPGNVHEIRFLVWFTSTHVWWDRQGPHGNTSSSPGKHYSTEVQIRGRRTGGGQCFLRNFVCCKIAAERFCQR